MAETPTLETARLFMRPYQIGDFDAYATMWMDPSVVRFIGGVPFTREQSWTRFLRQAGLWHHLGFGFFALYDKATGAFAGECGFHDMKRAIEPSLEGTMESGWALTAAHQGQGLAVEAMSAAIAWAAEHGKGKRFTAIIDPDNGASLHVAGKLGFREFARSEYGGHPIILLERPRQ